MGESASLDDKKQANGGTGEDPRIQYIVPPKSLTFLDLLIVIVYHMLPFSAVPTVVNLAILCWAVAWYGWIALAIAATGVAVLVALPPFYDRRIKKRMQVLYYPLARYARAMKYIVPKGPIPQSSYIFAFHPHGRMFFSNTVMCQLSDVWRGNWLPKGDLFTAAAAGFFQIPFLRSVLYLVGVMPASRANIISRLRHGHHVGIVVGGLKEVCPGTSDNTDTLYLLNRKGFIKIAIEEKVGIIPIYCFNENQLFRHDSKGFLEFWEKFNRYINIGIPFMRGVWQLPMPFRRELLCVVGDPVFPKEGESVDDFHARYIKLLRELFDEYVKLSPDPHHKLLIT